jgi:hypothetical protein
MFCPNFSPSHPYSWAKGGVVYLSIESSILGSLMSIVSTFFGDGPIKLAHYKTKINWLSLSLALHFVWLPIFLPSLLVFRYCLLCLCFLCLYLCLFRSLLLLFVYCLQILFLSLQLFRLTYLLCLCFTIFLSDRSWFSIFAKFVKLEFSFAFHEHQFLIVHSFAKFLSSLYFLWVFT